MSAKLIIYCSGTPNTNGHKRRGFLWNPQYNHFVFENRVMDEQEFNSRAELVFKKNSDLRPCVKVVEFSDAGMPSVATTITTSDPSPAEGRPISIEDALEVIQKLAPDKLKKTPGRKPAMMEV